MKFYIRVLWGAAIEFGGEPTYYEFNTQAEVDAFELGICEAADFMTYEVVERGSTAP